MKERNQTYRCHNCWNKLPTSRSCPVLFCLPDYHLAAICNKVSKLWLIGGEVLPLLSTTDFNLENQHRRHCFQSDTRAIVSFLEIYCRNHESVKMSAWHLASQIACVRFPKSDLFFLLGLYFKFLLKKVLTWTHSVMYFIKFHPIQGTWAIQRRVLQPKW